MLKLFEIRRRLIELSNRDALKFHPLCEQPVNSLFPQIDVTVSHDTRLSNVRILLEKSKNPTAIICDMNIVCGIVRQESLQLLDRNARFDLGELPVRSVMLRTFIIENDEISLGELLAKMLEQKLFAAVVIAPKTHLRRVVTVDMISKLFEAESETFFTAPTTTTTQCEQVQLQSVALGS